jgi:imidazolonepropionase-like amidohydrolase
MAMELAICAGGMLVVGTDPTGYGGVVASPIGAVGAGRGGLLLPRSHQIATLNGATYLGRQERIGSIAVGKQADLIVVNGDPSTHIADVERVEIVFKRGIGYDAEKLFASVKGLVGLR